VAIGGRPVGRTGGRALKDFLTVAVKRSLKDSLPVAGGRARRVAIVLAAVALGCHRGDRVVIGAKNFTESDLLAEIAAQQIERRTGLTVERKLHLGGTFVCHSAITAGQIDLYVEYTGTAYTAVLKHTAGPGADSVRQAVAQEYRQRWDLVWLEPFGFNNTFAIAVRQADVERLGLHTISDLARVAPHWHAGFGYEFLNRADGFPGLAAMYGLRFAAPPTAMDLGLTYRALADGKIDVIAGNSTDGQLAALHLVALVDDRHYFPPYEAAPVVRNAVLAQHPEVGRALLELRGKIDDDAMRRLNAMADVEHKDLHAIAHDWLARAVP
jgi:osmoprotectant transport system substrate-binding protein